MTLENERPSKAFRLGPVTGRTNKFRELVVCHRLLIKIERIQFDLPDWPLAIAGIRFGSLGTHQE